LIEKFEKSYDEVVVNLTVAAKKVRDPDEDQRKR
jgi:hypothetical protein